MWSGKLRGRGIVQCDTDMVSAVGIRLIPMQMVICFGSTGAGFLITKTGSYRPL